VTAALAAARRALARTWPEERVALVYVLALAALFAARGLPFTVVPLLGGYAVFLGTLAAMSLLPWIAVQALRRRRGTLDRARAAADVGQLARGCLALLVVLVGYTNLKSRLFALHPTLFDRELTRADAWLHFAGGDFLGWVLSTTHAPFRMAVLDLLYFYAWLPLALPFAAAFARAGGGAARRVLAACTCAYVAGGFCYLALPSVGPAFFERERFAHLAGLFGWKTQQGMLDTLRFLAAYPDAAAVPFLGIAAFPSLHLASTVVGLFAAARWNRWLLWLLVPWNLVIAWATVAWGWHYAIDLYAGALLAWGAWWLAGRLTEGPDARPPASASVSATDERQPA
jgi:membrane-associated phospholipid phosphatase